MLICESGSLVAKVFAQSYTQQMLPHGGTKMVEGGRRRRRLIRIRKGWI
uniref:Uncharacterized protein n=1 Tax=Salix viminalis TaxID=40686 RepID=A0A6N2LAL9_SALVM